MNEQAKPFLQNQATTAMFSLSVGAFVYLIFLLLEQFHSDLSIQLRLQISICSGIAFNHGVSELKRLYKIIKNNYFPDFKDDY